MSHQIVSIRRDPRGWWTCKALTGETVNVFPPSYRKPGTLRFFNAAGYGDLLATMQPDEVLRFGRHPIAVEMVKSGQYWEITGVTPASPEPDAPFAPDPALYREASQAWAARIMKGYVIALDTETTGVQAHDEPIQIAMTDGKGVSHCYRIKPSDLRLMDQENGAGEIHQLTRADMEFEAAFDYVYINGRLDDLNNYAVVGYNIAFDMDRLDYACYLYDLPPLRPLAMVDVMPRAAEYIGAWDETRERWVAWKLTEAAAILGIATDGAHDALADCLMTLALLRAMAEGVIPAPGVVEAMLAAKEALA